MDAKTKQFITQTTASPTQDEQALALLRIKRYYSLFRKIDYSTQSLPELIKIMAIQPCSHRLVSAVFYSKKHPEHQDQFSGRDLKRWAASQLGELFEDSSIMKEHWLPDFIGEHWHE